MVIGNWQSSNKADCSSSDTKASMYRIAEKTAHIVFSKKSDSLTHSVNIYSQSRPKRKRRKIGWRKLICISIKISGKASRSKPSAAQFHFLAYAYPLMFFEPVNFHQLFQTDIMFFCDTA